jgi:hypothetical protein
MYQYEGLGDCDVTRKFSTLSPGIDPIAAHATVCPLLRQNGRDLDWQDYLTHRQIANDPLSKYRQFLNEECYKNYLQRFCAPTTTVQPSTIAPPLPPNKLSPELIREIVKALTGITLPPPKPRDPTVPTTLKMRDL